MKYSNMILEELIKEAFHSDNQLALEIIEKLEQRLYELENDQSSNTIWQDGYNEGWNDALDAAVHKLELM